MKYINYYQTKENFSDIIMVSDGQYLTGLSFVGHKDSKEIDEQLKEKELTIFKETKRWLDQYFNGKIPDFDLKYKLNNLTPFRKEVLEIVSSIPYGNTITYGMIAKKIAKKRKINKMSAQAVGGAVGSNPIIIIIPCHRVIGSDNSLTGYAGGFKNKIELLKLEKVIVDNDTCIVKY